uniref:RING-type E3 ubiquitin transferase n=1 Tax=Astyanax mexicanus TaxID=7994 RepID=A0A3B1IPM0_ASTMX
MLTVTVTNAVCSVCVFCVCVCVCVDDVLARDAGECVICLEELQQGDTIARLPCLCIYHKKVNSTYHCSQITAIPAYPTTALLY